MGLILLKVVGKTMADGMSVLLPTNNWKIIKQYACRQDGRVKTHTQGQFVGFYALVQL